jgi:hypothetical protein
MSPVVSTSLKRQNQRFFTLFFFLVPPFLRVGVGVLISSNQVAASCAVAVAEEPALPSELRLLLNPGQATQSRGSYHALGVPVSPNVARVGVTGGVRVWCEVSPGINLIKDMRRSHMSIPMPQSKPMSFMTRLDEILQNVLSLLAVLEPLNQFFSLCRFHGVFSL